MKVILTADLDKIGNLGDVLDVKPGFARNYLLPKKLAVLVSEHNLSVMDGAKKKHLKKLEMEKLSAEQQKTRLETLTLTFHKKAGESDVIFGAVTTSEIEKELEAKGVTIDRKKIHLEEPIKRIGNYTCKIKLFRDVEASIKIEVLKEGEESAEA